MSDHAPVNPHSLSSALGLGCFWASDILVELFQEMIKRLEPQIKKTREVVRLDIGLVARDKVF